MPLKSSKIVTVRPTTKSDIKLLVSEWRYAYPDEFNFKYPARWKWQFENNPFLYKKRTGFELPVWIAIYEDKIAGWTCAQMAMAKVLEHEVSLAYSIDTHVKASYRLKNIGISLQKENQKNHPIFMSIQMSEGSRRIKSKIGGQNGAPFKIFLKLYKHFDSELLYKNVIDNSKLKAIVKYIKIIHTLVRGFDFKLVSWILSILLKTSQKRNARPIGALKKNRGLYFEEIDFFGSEATQFWRKIKHNYGFSVIRDQHYLNWKYVLQPQLNYRKFYAKIKNEIVGLLILRIGQAPELKVGVIAEALAIDNSTWIFNEMLAFAENTLRPLGALMIRCGSSICELDNALDMAGYQPIELKVPVLFINKTMISIDYEKLIKSSWLMSLGDQDMDIPLLNQQPALVHIIYILIGKIPGQQYVLKNL